MLMVLLVKCYWKTYQLSPLSWGTNTEIYGQEKYSHLSFENNCGTFDVFWDVEKAFFIIFGMIDLRQANDILVFTMHMIHFC